MLSGLSSLGCIAGLLGPFSECGLVRPGHSRAQRAIEVFSGTLWGERQLPPCRVLFASDGGSLISQKS